MSSLTSARSANWKPYKPRNQGQGQTLPQPPPLNLFKTVLFLSCPCFVPVLSLCCPCVVPVLSLSSPCLLPIFSLFSPCLVPVLFSWRPPLPTCTLAVFILSLWKVSSPLLSLPVPKQILFQNPRQLVTSRVSNQVFPIYIITDQCYISKIYANWFLLTHVNLIICVSFVCFCDSIFILFIFL